jgi:riboflavin kinase/FMN adenylyltransferase
MIRVTGEVKRGRNLGAKLGYPTANIESERNLTPGIYIGFTSLDESNNSDVIQAFSREKLPSLIYASHLPGNPGALVESHVLDFPEVTLYGSKITVELVHKIRESEYFENDKDLIKKIKQDELEAREWFKKNPKK